MLAIGLVLGLAGGFGLALALRRPAPSGVEQAITELRLELQRSLGATEQQVLTQTGATHRALGDVARELGALGEQSARVAELARDMGSLADILRSPSPRGAFGELLLERVLADALPASAFALQHEFRDGSRVDAVVRFGGRLVPIDAKFPIEAYRALAGARGEEARRQQRRTFTRHLQRHVDGVARYIVPAENTIDYAFMYVPSESVFAELIAAGEEDTENDISRRCAERRVIPASPNTLLAYLRVVALALRGLAVADGVRLVQASVDQAMRELERVADHQRILGTHLENAQRKHQEAGEGIQRTAAAVAGIGRAAEASAPARPRLELVPDDDALDGHP